MHHILLLEDDAPLRAALVRSLQDIGDVTLTGVGSLGEALRALDALPPTIVVSDLELPDGNGLDVLPELAARGLRVPVVFITAHHTRFSAALPTSPNVEVLQKPFSPEQLKNVVRARLQAKDQDPAFAVSDYLQLAGMARRSVLLSVHQGSQHVGDIVVQDGQPRWAADQSGEGEEAFRRIALLPRAQVVCQALVAPPQKVNLSGSLEHLLIDAARYADEVDRAPKAAPPPITSPPPPSPPSAAPPRLQRPPLPPRPSEARLRSAADVTPPSSPSTPALSQEKTVNVNKPTFTAQHVLALDPSLKAAARADRQGSVLDMAGELDAETACAVATMATREIAEAAAELGFGRPYAWQLSVSGSTWYVALGREQLFVGQGAVNKNPGALLKKLAKSCGAGT
jgi:DNA-binding response OmpR family regulator